jgi:hypothetical protein
MPPTPAFKTIGIISRPRRSTLAEVVPALLHWLEKRGVNAVYDGETAICMKADGKQARHAIKSRKRQIFFWFSEVTEPFWRWPGSRYCGIPILPINMGSLVF